MKTLVLSLMLTLVAQSVAARDLLVFAAASLRDGLEAVLDDWDGDVTVSYAGSSALARQIEQGAPADIFISASVAWADYLQERGHLVADTRRDLLGNQLVLIAYDPDFPEIEISKSTDFPALLDGGVMAMALVEAVPAGIYGKAALTHLGQWEALKGQVAQSDNVRAALRLVDLGEAPLGVVYRTDVAAGEVKIVGAFPDGSHPPIVYPAAVTAESSHDSALAFLDFLSSPQADAHFRRFGFTVLD